MSSLTSTQINNTYPGLLKLANSTTGITSSIQSVEDGLGGDTGLKIKQNYLGGGSQIPMPPQDTTVMAYGLGMLSTGVGTAFVAGSHNCLYTQVFYDRGHITYSAITYSIGTVSTTSDVIEMGIYTSQITPTGYQPKDLIGSFTLSGTELTTLGMAKKVLPSNITLSEGNIYFIGYVGTNATSATPTVRFRTPGSGTQLLVNLLNFNGFVPDLSNAGYVSLTRGATTANGGVYYSGISGALQNSYAPSIFTGTISSSSAPAVGFVLHPVN